VPVKHLQLFLLDSEFLGEMGNEVGVTSGKCKEKGEVSKRCYYQRYKCGFGSPPQTMSLVYLVNLVNCVPLALKDNQVTRFFTVITDLRDRDIFILMLRCGLRVQEVANLTITLSGINLRGNDYREKSLPRWSRSFR
jgi:hypothetical protein